MNWLIAYGVGFLVTALVIVAWGCVAEEDPEEIGKVLAQGAIVWPLTWIILIGLAVGEGVKAATRGQAPRGLKMTKG